MNDSTALQDGGSFRDRAGSIFLKGERVFRGCSISGAERLARAEQSGFLAELVSQGRLVPYEDAVDISLPPIQNARVLEHPRIPFISYPYEWTFKGLKKAALFHLDIQLDAFDKGLHLLDATPYNIQFDQGNPIFIDHLSFEIYENGEPWWAYGQFLEQFLNPLLVMKYTGNPVQDIYRSRIEGISSESARKMLGHFNCLRPKIFPYVTYPALLQDNTPSKSAQKRENHSGRGHIISASDYKKRLKDLQKLIRSLEIEVAQSSWSEYADERAYDADDLSTKLAFVERFCQKNPLDTFVDLGCNTGEFSRLALSCGAQNVISIDSDISCLNALSNLNLPLLPIYADLSNPTPGLGWRGIERKSLLDRCQQSTVLALALIHHLALRSRVPISWICDFLTSTFARGIVEFVPLSDPMVQILMRNARQIPEDYNQEAFEAGLSAGSIILEAVALPTSGRILYNFEAKR